MNLPKSARLLFVVICSLTIFAFGYLSANVVGQRTINRTGQSANTSGVGLISGDLSQAVEAFQKLQQFYLSPEKLDKQAAVEGATKGLVAGLNDRYTNYYTKSEWAEIQQSNSGAFQGVGIKLMPSDDYVVVETPLVGTPAERAGIKALDVLLEANNESLVGLSVAQVAQKIRGPEGSKVSLKIFRPSTEERLDFELTRSQIDTNSIELKKLDSGVYQLIISKFTESDMSEFQSQWQAAVNTIAQDKDAKVILDLRNNTGGWVVAARYILEEFLPVNSVVLREVDRDGKEDTISTTRQGSLLKNPLAVLVNSGSASASEIVAGALQDYDRAKLLGEPTTGKGVEQTVQNTSDGGVMFIVFKKWLTPKGKNLSQSDSLKPDEVVSLQLADIKANRDPQLDAAKLVLK